MTDLSAPVIHLVSDSTGETAAKVLRACMVQFPEVHQREMLWPFIRTPGQLTKVLASIEATRGLVLYTLVDTGLQQQLQVACKQMRVQAFSMLAPVLKTLEEFLGVKHHDTVPGLQHQLDDLYFRRMEAIDFAITHDDGQALSTLHEADVILVGVSRMSKTPTSIYLAYRGVRAANVPLVPECPLPAELEECARAQRKPLIIGLTQDVANLAAVRGSRMAHLSVDTPLDYSNFEQVREEVLYARRLFSKYQWPVIDVTRKSVEETAALVIHYWQQQPLAADKVES